ncbi:MAG: S49 family peptidase, partial [Planctomycetales bacterium]|nr:S49 family peptidase [Planctomycetales bacterium]
MKYLLDRFVILSLLLSLSTWSFAQDTATAEKEADKTEQKEEAEASKKETAEKEAKRKTDKSEEEEEEEEPDEEQETPKLQVRVLALSGVYVDQLQPGAIDPTSLLLGGVPVKQKSFYRLCEYLDELAEDDEIQSVVFDLSDDSLSMNSAQLDEFTRRMSQFKHAKKKTVAWLENASNVHLAIAACCDHVLMADMGSVDMPSAAMQSMFYKDAMDLVGVKASVVRAGDFKGAVEPYVNPVMSQHLREHYQEMLESINGAHVNRIAEGRGLTVAEVRQLQAKRLILPKEAAAKGLVDELAPYGSMNQAVEKHLGEEIEWITTKSKPRKQMSFFELMGKLMAGPPTESGKTRDASIAVLHLSGTIVDGKKSTGGSIVSGPTVTAIEELAEDENVKGV